MNKDDDDKITYFAYTDSRSKKIPFGIKRKDRSRHMYIIGKTGMGKSTLLENLAIQDIQNGEGVAFIDPHGKSADLLLEYVPEHRIEDVLYFAPFDMEHPISFNVMEDVGHEKRHLVSNGLMSAFKKIWVDAWSARMEYILNNILLALLEYPDSTLIGVNRMLADKEYRKKVVENITDPSVKSFWNDEFAKYGDRYMQEAGAAIQNKIGQFISNPLVRNIIGQPKSSFDLRKFMDDKKIIIINLAKGRVGEANANLLGSMLITKIYLSAMSRADLNESALNKLPHFYLYVDEFQSFANESFADILSESRKYKLNLIMAHQYVEQMSEEVTAAVFGNVGTMIAFRVGALDAELLEKEFAPEFTAEDMVNLGFVQIYLKLMINGVASPPFSATTMPPISKSPESFKDRIVLNSRVKFANARQKVEEDIRIWHQPIRPERKEGDRTFDKNFAGKQERFQNPTDRQSQFSNRDRRDFRGNRTNEDNRRIVNVNEKKFEQNNRQASLGGETEMRKALSLSYLKTEKKEDEEKQKRIQAKAQSAQNISALRQALEAITRKESQSEKKTENIDEKKINEPIKADNPKDQNEALKKTEESNPHSRNNPDVIDIPEDILKRVLND